MKFLRIGSSRFKRLGKGRKKLQRWRKARGRDNKIREKKKGRPRRVEIGYKKQKKRKEIMIIKNMKQAERVKKGEQVIIGRIGRKKRIEIEKKIKEIGGRIVNIKKADKK